MIWFDMPQLEYPVWLNAKLNRDYLHILEETKEFMITNRRTTAWVFNGFYDFEISKVQRLIDWISSPVDFDLNVARKDFYLFYKEYDKRNNTNFNEYFPEYVQFMNECSKL
jgi:hypothetical protein